MPKILQQYSIEMLVTQLIPKALVYSRSCHQRPCFCQTKKSLVAESRWSQEWVFAVKFEAVAAGSMPC